MCTEADAGLTAVRRSHLKEERIVVSTPGIFTLQSPRDLLDKLRHDHARLKANPNDPYVAFDLFVTAEHFLDWIYPGAAGKASRTAERSAQPLLQVISHLAAGAKHMVAEDRRHVSVQHADVAPSTYGTAEYGTAVYGGYHLVITLNGAAAQQLGSSITALGLASRVVSYWEHHPLLR